MINKKATQKESLRSAPTALDFSRGSTAKCYPIFFALGVSSFRVQFLWFSLFLCVVDPHFVSVQDNEKPLNNAFLRSLAVLALARIEGFEPSLTTA